VFLKNRDNLFLWNQPEKKNWSTNKKKALPREETLWIASYRDSD